MDNMLPESCFYWTITKELSCLDMPGSTFGHETPWYTLAVVPRSELTFVMAHPLGR